MIRTILLLGFAAAFVWAVHEYSGVFVFSFLAGLAVWEFGYWGITGRWFWVALLRDDGSDPSRGSS